ncbi:MAG: SPOR domain-containing protein [Burkholderiales bacterium]|nr:SPOR domain-containing protein [Burkholderiales bacterium]
MASTKSPELSATEIELKRRGRRRLIGAATIGLLGIVFLPMIFDGEPRRSPVGSALKKQEISVQVPPKEGQPALPTPTAAPVPAATATPPTLVEPVKQAAVAASKPAPETPVAKPTVATVASTIEKPEPATKAPVAAESPKKGFAVQLGVIADVDNAKLTIAKMKDAKLPVYSESIPIKSGAATRVRIGPFASREKADAALVQIKLAGSDGKIIPLQ